MISENQEYWSMSIQDHSSGSLMTPGHHLDAPKSFLGTSFLPILTTFDETEPRAEGFPVSHRDNRHTIGKLIINDYDRR